MTNHLKVADLLDLTGGVMSRRRLLGLAGVGTAGLVLAGRGTGQR
jgi:hypothetical protein